MGFWISSTLTIGAMLVLSADPLELWYFQIATEGVVYLIVLLMALRIVFGLLMWIVDEMADEEAREARGYTPLADVYARDVCTRGRLYLHS